MIQRIFRVATYRPGKKEGVPVSLIYVQAFDEDDALRQGRRSLSWGADPDSIEWECTEVVPPERHACENCTP